MNDTITKGELKTKGFGLNAEKFFSLAGVKAAAAFAFGFVTALPIKLIGVSPFAAAAVAIVPRSYVFLCYLGGFFSYMTGSFMSSAAPVSAMTAIMLFRLLFKGKGKTLSDKVIAPIAVALALIVTGLLCGDISVSNLTGSFGWLAICAAAAGSTVLFRSAVGHYGKPLCRLTPGKLASLSAAVLLLLLPLESLKPFGVSLLAATSAAAALIYAFRLDNTEAFFASGFFGAAWAAGAAHPEYLLILPACVMGARLPKRLGKLPCAAAFIALRFGFNLIFTPITELMPQMIEVLIAAAIFALIPQRMLSPTSLLAVQETYAPAEAAAEKLKETASLFRYISESIADVSAEVSRELTPSPKGCVAHIRDSLCSRCELTKFCTGVKSEDVSRGIYEYASGIQKGVASASLLPRCAHPAEMEAAIRSYMVSATEQNPETRDIRELSTLSYNIVSGALEDLSAEIAAEHTVAEGVSSTAENIEIGCARYKNERETNSGDNCEYFTRGKYLYVIISDGMGSGRLASIDSRMTCGLLKRFLYNGLSFATALRLANAALKLKGGEESFATADICKLDTETGAFTIAKAGAAASYIISENRVRRLYAPSFPVGILNEASIEEIHAKLKRNDRLIMLSDGALNNGDEWIESAHLYDLDVHAACDKLVRLGRESYGSSPADDITAICVRFK